MRLEELTDNVDDEEEEDEDGEETLEEQLTEAVDLLETCHKVLRRELKRNPAFKTKFNQNLLDDIGFFVDSMTVEE